MTCADCGKPQKSLQWTPIPEYKQPTEMLQGENIECYSKRAGNQSGMMDDSAQKPINKINNNTLTSDLELKVDEQFTLTPGSDRVVTEWYISVNDGANPLSELSFLNGRLSGTVSTEHAEKNYKVLIKASDAAGLIDSREYNFFPKKGTKSDTVKFVFPYTPNGRITSPFGERVHPVTGQKKLHAGIDISQPGTELGEILATADGTVVKAGPASGYGNWIQIEHKSADGKIVATSLYGHMRDIYVKVGQQVSAGQKIAKEGSEGVGTAAHLHFEIHKGGYKNPVDPVDYINGNFVAADNNSAPGVPTNEKNVSNGNKGMTSQEAEAARANDCPKTLPNQAPAEVPGPGLSPGDPGMEQALSEDASLDEDDKKLLRFMAKIESRNIPTAKNPTSSALGLFQMLDKIASIYFKKISVDPSYENRTNAYLSTKAQIRFYLDEQKKYWNDYNTSNKTILAGVTLSSDVANKYATYDKGTFIYGLIHHDGVGNAVRGVDRQGVDYYRKKINEA